MPDEIAIFQRMSGPYNLDTYFLVCRQTGESIIIDPKNDTRSVLGFITKNKGTPVKLVHTHRHADQFFSTKIFKQTHNIPNCLHAGSSNQSTLEKEIRDNIYITDFILDT